MVRLFLVGYMGAGKTTFGKLLADSMNVGFIDLDIFIENRYQKSIGKLFEELGEEKFRHIEYSILKEVGGFEDVVISTGGGTPCFFDSMKYMKEEGKTIYLKSSPGVLIKRLDRFKDKRPLLKNKSWQEMEEFVSVSLSKREVFYNQADFIFEIDEIRDNQSRRKLIAEIISKIQ